VGFACARAATENHARAVFLVGVPVVNVTHSGTHHALLAFQFGCKAFKRSISKPWWNCSTAKHSLHSLALRFFAYSIALFNKLANVIRVLLLDFLLHASGASAPRFFAACWYRE